MDVEDTIVGLATATGGAPRGVVRISGPGTLRCLQSCFRAMERPISEIKLPRIVAAEISLPSPLGPVPGELYVWPTPRSYTRQPAAEFHTLGSPPLLEAALRTLCRSGARLAEPGEFTLRAFLAGRIDLTQAEAVLGVIDAVDERELRCALGQLAGGLAAPLDEVRTRLVELLAEVEAGLDFVEEDISFIEPAELCSALEDLSERVEGVARQLAQREGEAYVPRVALVGLPNAGKSSLFNCLVGDASAIVSEAAGTTRDYLTCRLALGGLQVELVDTAGVADSATPIEDAAQSKTKDQAEAADLRLLCVDASDPANGDPLPELEVGARTILVFTKCDATAAGRPLAGGLRTSAKRAEGIEALRRQIRRFLLGLSSGAAVAVPATSTRCHSSLERTLDCLNKARAAAEGLIGEEIVAAELRGALDELGKVVGAVYTDDILDVVFSRFCIGK